MHRIDMEHGNICKISQSPKSYLDIEGNVTQKLLPNSHEISISLIEL